LNNSGCNFLRETRTKAQESYLAGVIYSTCRVDLNRYPGSGRYTHNLASSLLVISPLSTLSAFPPHVPLLACEIHTVHQKKKSTVIALGNAWTTTETHVRVNHTVHRHDDTCVATESHAQFCRDLRHKKQREGEASREQADGEHTSRRRQITASRSHVHRPHTLIMCSSFMSRSNKDII